MKEGKCIMGEMRKDREVTETDVLVETYEKKIWQLQQSLSKAIEELSVLEGTKKIVVEMAKEKISWKKRAQEAEGELSIVKTTSVTNSPEMRAANAKIQELQNSLDRFKSENNECYNRIAEALEVNESHQKLNGKLQQRITELEDKDKIDRIRKAGL